MAANPAPSQTGLRGLQGTASCWQGGGQASVRQPAEDHEVMGPPCSQGSSGLLRGFLCVLHGFYNKGAVFSREIPLHVSQILQPWQPAHLAGTAGTGRGTGASGHPGHLAVEGADANSPGGRGGRVTCRGPPGELTGTTAPLELEVKWTQGLGQLGTGQVPASGLLRTPCLGAAGPELGGQRAPLPTQH